MTVTLHFQSTGATPGNATPVAMRGASLTIGRGLENDLVLPDPDRTLSKFHCSVEERNGDVIVLDHSTNGTFLNYGKIPLGPTPTPVNDGDILCLGKYELMVSISGTGPQPALPENLPPLDERAPSGGMGVAEQGRIDLLDTPGEEGDFLNDLLGGSSAPSGPGSVSRPEIGDDGLLPPLGEDDLALPGDARPDTGPAVAQPMHNDAQQDHFIPPPVKSGPQEIPDDWDDDFLSDLQPAPKPAAPAAKPAPELPQDVPEDPVETAGDPFDELDDVTLTPEAEAPEPAAEVELEETVLPDAVPEPVENAAAKPRPAPEPEPGAGPAPVAAAPSTPASAGQSAAALAYLRALGIDDPGLDDAALERTMEKMGNVTRILVQGLREVLMTRSSLKSEFRVQQTVIGAGGNNPLKFSVSPEQAVQALVEEKSKGYLEATAAAEQALQDIRAHEVAVLSGMEAALKGVLAQLSPEQVAGKIETSAGFGSLLKGKKARYWEVYEKMYSEIAGQAEDDFFDLFSRTFAKAYQEQIERLKQG